MDKLIPSVGNWVDGNRFWDRKEELKLFMGYLDEGSCIHLCGPRRIGKTSLMREASRLLKDRYTCLHVDLERCSSAAEAIVQLGVATRPFQKLWTKTQDVFKNTFQAVIDRVDSLQIEEVAIKLREGVSAGNWQQKGDSLLAKLATSDPPVILFLDEVPILLSNILRPGNGASIEQADSFMSWLRYNTIEHSGKLPIVMTGSIGMEPMLERVGLSATINTFRPFALTPWDRQTAIACLEALAKGKSIAFDQGVCEQMVKRIGCCIPSHVQMYFARVSEFCTRRGDMAVSTRDAERVYRESMVVSTGNHEMNHYAERLEKALDGKILSLAQDFLTEAAIKGRLDHEAASVLCQRHGLEGRAAGDATTYIMGILQHDGYLRPTRKGYVYISNLLRDWWKLKFGFIFDPTDEGGTQ